MRPRRPSLVRPSFFAWLVVPALIYGGYRLNGLPHMVWNYDYHGSRADWSARRYTRCTFIGPYGAFTTFPADGRCGWIAFFHQREGGQ